MELIDKYKQMNESFKVKLIHHFGMGWGFFSELNSLLLTTLYCAQNHIRLELYSNDAKFCFGNGWEEYFEPFCPKFRNDFIGARINQGYYKFNPGNKYLYLYKLLSNNFISNDVFWLCRSSWFEKMTFNIPELEINGDIRQALNIIISIVYRFNKKYTDIINELSNTLKMPEHYISLHIRAGDKVQERDLITPQNYLEEAKKYSSCHNVFIATDDFRIFESLRNNNPDYNFFTLTSEDEEGYNNSSFMTSTDESIRSNLTELFASIQIILKSDLFIGTYSSNPGMFIGMQMQRNRMIGMDFDKWLII